MESVLITVEGMACGDCEATVANAVRRLPGIKKAKANRRKKLAAVEYDPALITLDEIKAAIAATGYDVKD